MSSSVLVRASAWFCLEAGVGRVRNEFLGRALAVEIATCRGADCCEDYFFWERMRVRVRVWGRRLSPASGRREPALRYHPCALWRGGRKRGFCRGGVSGCARDACVSRGGRGGSGRDSER
jgi:hypothetical protein